MLHCYGHEMLKGVSSLVVAMKRLKVWSWLPRFCLLKDHLRRLEPESLEPTSQPQQEMQLVST